MFETILGLVMFYSWIHATVLCCKHIKGVSTYEKVVLWVAFGSFVLYLLGTLA